MYIRNMKSKDIGIIRAEAYDLKENELREIVRIEEGFLRRL